MYLLFNNYRNTFNIIIISSILIVLQSYLPVVKISNSLFLYVDLLLIYLTYLSLNRKLYSIIIIAFFVGIFQDFIIQNDVIVIPPTDSGTSDAGTVPAWVKNNAGWWSQGAITDADFVNGIQFLIEAGLIQIG